MLKIRWPENRDRAVWVALTLAGCLAVGAGWLEQWRLPSLDRFASSVFRVTSARADGPGSLRVAILAADRAPGRARIVVTVAKIAIETALPPLVNPRGVVLEAAPAGVELDGTRVTGAVLDIASPGSLVSGFRIVGGGAGVVVRAPGATLRNLTLLEHDTGILVGENAAQIDVVGSRFTEDAIGVVAINVNARVEASHFTSEGSAAVYASGARAAIVNNRIFAGHGFGIHSEELQSGTILQNEIARNCNGGILLRDSANTQVLGNDLYQNGYGIVLMEGQALRPNTVANNLIADDLADGLLLIGSSPIVRGNRVLRNRHAGLRMSSLRLGSGPARIPTPFMAENLVQGNGVDDVQRDRYVPGTQGTSLPAAPECVWRLGPPAVSAVQRTGAR